MCFCCVNTKDICKAFQQELNQERPFQNVSEELLEDLFDQLCVYMRKKYPQKYGQKPNKITTEINQNPKRIIKRYENQEKKPEVDNQKTLETSIKPLGKNSQQYRFRQPSINLRASKHLERRSSGFSPTQNSQMTEMDQLTDKIYSLPREVCELKEIELLTVIRQQNSQKFESFLQMKKINQITIIEKEEQIVKLKQRIKELQVQKQTFKQQISSNKHSADAMIYQIQSLSKTIQSLSKKIENLSTQNIKLNQSNTKMMEDIKINNGLKQQNLKLQQKIKGLHQLLAQKQTKKTLEVTNSSQLEENEYQTILKYFGKSNLLPSYEDREDAAKIRNQILKMFSRSISSTKLLYIYQARSNLHFNEYIQNKNNLFVLIELQNKIYIGGFAGEADQNQNIEDTFLFSISLKREPIRLVAREKIKRIDGEKGFLNFGNGQIRIKARSTSLSCNVSGISIKYFNGERRVSIDRFLGDEERSRDVKGYQIYQVFFQDSK